MKLAADGGVPVISPAIEYRWPKPAERWTKRVTAQLDSGRLSIYDRSGVVAEIEDAWSALHGVGHSLAVNSGTAALHSAFYAVGLGPGDEVLCPTYTFFATAAPLFQLGALPVLVDADEHGSFDAAHAASLVTERTKACVVTHMWGLPCDMDSIVSLCDEHGLDLLEDCSHAHGALYRGRLVGTFGAAGAWSMQTQKLIAAGEGGMMATDRRDVYDRGQLLGHFNKRAMQEMDRDGPLFEYSTTGVGLKYRAHPLALAFAVDQVGELEDWVRNKQRYAERLVEHFESIDGVRAVTVSGADRTSAHYALLFDVDPVTFDGGRDRLVEVWNREGIADVDIPKATSPLHTLHLFREPISPVHAYDRSCIRSAYPMADRLATRTFKVSVPCAPLGFEDEDDAYLDVVGRIAGKVRDATVRR